MDMQGSPQTGDGFVRIANELFDALIDVRIPGEVRRVFDYILRMTYGYNRKTFETTQHKIAQRLKTSQQRVFEALRWLSDALFEERVVHAAQSGLLNRSATMPMVTLSGTNSPLDIYDWASRPADEK